MSIPNNYQCAGQLSIEDVFDQDLWFGRMSQVHSVQTKEKISDVSSKKQRESPIKMPLFLDLRRGGRWSNSGAILGDGWSIAWRVHDAQFWGVPQRRKRISLVADFGGESAPEILFERSGVSGDSEESGEKRQDITGAVADSPSETISFQERSGKPGGGKGILIQHERTGALSTLNNQSVLQDRVYCLQGNGIDRADTAGCNGKGWRENESYTLNTIDRPAVCYETYQKTTGALMASGYEKLGTQEAANDMFVVQEPCSWDGSQTAPTLTANNAGGSQRMPDKDNFNAVLCYGLDRASFNQGKNAKYDFSVQEEIAQTIVAKGPGGVLTPQ